MKPIFIVILFAILLNASQLTRANNIVTDKVNNKMWQDNEDTKLVLVSQKTAPLYCMKLQLGGFKDWRVPTVDEYEAIIDKTRKDELMINRKFKYIVQDGYWTKDRTWRNFGIWGYYIYFKSGTAYYENRDYPKYIRCVRDINK